MGESLFQKIFQGPRTFFLYRILKIKPIVVRQVLDGRSIEVRTMGQLLTLLKEAKRK